MKIVRHYAFRNRKSQRVRNFLEVETTLVEGPSAATFVEIEEIPEEKDSSTGARIRIGYGSTGMNLYELFIQGEYLSGEWEQIIGPKHMVLDPAPDLEEDARAVARVARAKRSLLDSASAQLKRKKPGS